MDVQFWWRNRDAQYDRVESMIAHSGQKEVTMNQLEICHVLVGLLGHAKYDGHEVVEAAHDGKYTLWVDLRRPGGGVEYLTLKIGE